MIDWFLANAGSSEAIFDDSLYRKTIFEEERLLSQEERSKSTAENHKKAFNCIKDIYLGKFTIFSVRYTIHDPAAHRSDSSSFFKRVL
jgi:hypothetical protein